MKDAVNRLTGKKRSASTAKERLKLVLIHDRTDLPPGVMQDLRDELIEVISRHINVDKENVHIRVQQDGRKQRLVADIPLQTAQRRR